jgi:hypothetical protein
MFMELLLTVDTINAKCGSKRGCEIDYALPHGGVLRPFLSVYVASKGDIRQVRTISKLSMDQMAKETGSLEKKAA